MNNKSEKRYFITSKFGDYLKINEILININDRENTGYIYVDNKLINLIKCNNKLSKYIQISSNNKIMCIPDDDTLYFYRCNNFIDESFDTFNNIKLNKIQYGEHELYKSVLFNDKLICIFKDNYDYILNIYNFKTKNITNKKLLNCSYFTLSENGNNLLTYNGKYFNIMSDNSNKKIKNYDLILNTLNLSDNEETVIFINKNEKLCVNDFESDIKVKNTNKLVLSIIYYEFMSHFSINNCHVINLWNIIECTIICVLFYECDNKFFFTELANIDCSHKNELNYMFYNNHQYIYKFNDVFEIYDIDNIVCKHLIDLILNKQIKVHNNNKIIIKYNDCIKEITLSECLVNIKEIKFSCNFNEKHMYFINLFMILLNDHNKIPDYVNKIINNTKETRNKITIEILSDIGNNIKNSNKDISYYIDFVLLKLALYENNFIKENGKFIISNKFSKLYGKSDSHSNLIINNEITKKFVALVID